MKKITFLIAITAVLFNSCTQEFIEGVTDPNLLGDWKLVQVLADPGDGSGTFQDIDSDSELSFQSDGTFISNSPLCNFANQSGSSMKGTYDVENKSMESDDCSWDDWRVDYSVDGNTLILYFLCIEPCAQKYKRIGR